jgi:regulator of sirC expression with transglutaminase-like and TPR domain
MLGACKTPQLTYRLIVHLNDVDERRVREEGHIYAQLYYEHKVQTSDISCHILCLLHMPIC